MKKGNIVFEEFPSLDSLLKIIKGRKNNKYMSADHASEKSGGSWSGTETYEEAEKLCRYGDKKYLTEVKESIKKEQKRLVNLFGVGDKISINNSVIGFIPNVPNAIMGLPKSMIDIQKEPKKIKTVDLCYFFGGSANVDADDLIKAGTALVIAIAVLEKQGVRVQLKLNFIPAKEADEYVCPLVTLKRYGDQLSLQKLLFPLINPAMFRRIGFKWLETTPDCEENFSGGYGYPYTNKSRWEEAQKELKPYIGNSIAIGYYDIKDLEFDSESIINLIKERRGI